MPVDNQKVVKVNMEVVFDSFMVLLVIYDIDQKSKKNMLVETKHGKLPE